MCSYTWKMCMNDVLNNSLGKQNAYASRMKGVHFARKTLAHKSLSAFAPVQHMFTLYLASDILHKQCMSNHLVTFV